MWKMIIGVSSPETVTDNIFYYLYTTEDGVIHRKLYVKENGKPLKKKMRQLCLSAKPNI